MDCCARFRAIPLLDALPVVVRSDGGRLRRQRASVKLGSFSPVRHFLGFQGIAKFHLSSCFASPRAPSLITVASAESHECESGSVGTPLEPRSPEGKFLCGILKNHPHVFPVAAAEQLEELATNRESAFARWKHSAGSSESCLHGRIAEMKESECQFAIEEVMYFLIVHNFYEFKVPMIPNLSKCTNNGRLEIWSTKDQELESIHEPEVLEMVREHLSNILRWKCKADIVVNWSTLNIKRLQLGRVYAASIMYGYFLKSVRLRHRLELSLPSTHVAVPRFQKYQREENFVALGCSIEMESSSLCPSSGRGGMAEKLRGYMMGFDSMTLQICAKLRSREAASLIENHSWALFGDPKKNNSEESDEVVTVSVLGLKRLVLEAVAFGSFLWDVEGYADSVYRLKEN